MIQKNVRLRINTPQDHGALRGLYGWNDQRRMNSLVGRGRIVIMTAKDKTASNPTRAALTRRRLLATTGAVAATGLAAPYLGAGRAFAQKPTEIVHWSWLAASDGEVWGKMIDSFNEAHKDENVQIRMELVPEEQYVTKVLAATATGRAPDFGWGTAGKGAALAKDGVTVPLDDLITEVGLDIGDFTESSVKASRYPKYGNEMYMVPMDLMSLQPLINLDHVAEAGLDAEKPPQTNPGILGVLGPPTEFP
mgnify:CR=1 FL=1